VGSAPSLFMEWSLVLPPYSEAIKPMISHGHEYVSYHQDHQIHLEGRRILEDRSACGPLPGGKWAPHFWYFGRT